MEQDPAHVVACLSQPSWLIDVGPSHCVYIKRDQRNFWIPWCTPRRVTNWKTRDNRDGEMTPSFIDAGIWEDNCWHRKANSAQKCLNIVVFAVNCTVVLGELCIPLLVFVANPWLAGLTPSPTYLGSACFIDQEMRKVEKEPGRRRIFQLGHQCPSTVQQIKRGKENWCRSNEVRTKNISFISYEAHGLFQSKKQIIWISPATVIFQST